MNETNVQVFDKGYRNRCAYCGEKAVVYVGRPDRKATAISLCAGCEGTLVQSVADRYALLTVDAAELLAEAAKAEVEAAKKPEVVEVPEAVEVEKPVEEKAPVPKKAASSTAKKTPAKKAE